MNINITTVKKQCTSSNALNNYVQGILINFQRNIIAASKNGQTGISCPVPANFTIAGMSNKNAQTIIYSRLIKEVEKQGFTCKLSMGASVVTYHISWIFDDDDSSLKDMQKTIAKHVLDK